MFPPQATLPTTFRWLSKTQRTACEILEFLRETKCPLNSQKNNLQNNIFFFFTFIFEAMKHANHETLDLLIMPNSVLYHHKTF